jgi:hypothetical protein
MPDDTGSNAVTSSTIAPPPAPSPAPAGAPPPAASTVVAGKTREGDLDLAAELEKERNLRKQREIRAAELEDENRRLKAIPPSPAAVQKRSFLEGATFFE